MEAPAYPSPPSKAGHVEQGRYGFHDLLHEFFTMDADSLISDEFVRTAYSDGAISTLLGI
jgi:hypothetical protein